MKPGLDLYLSEHSDVVTSWKDKVDVIRAAPSHPISEFSMSVRYQGDVKQAFLAYVQDHRSMNSSLASSSKSVQMGPVAGKSS
jgi:hypothetical protein